MADQTSTASRTRPELLAPAGGPEAGYAALQYGADAVYLGLSRFSARAEAENFTPAALSDFVGYAHASAPRRRVYVTLNTLMLQQEVGGVLEALDTLAALGVDAVIVQDAGVYRLVRRHFPSLRLHASTQMAVHNREGVAALRDLGFARVTLARELTETEIAAAAAVPGIEIETFVHGALCYAYSGLCLFSSQLRGRSGNRGCCAYVCRDRFRVEGAARRVPGPETAFLFSMKDLATPEGLPALRAAGVAALKIEGRMKSALYVAAAVRFYRLALDGQLTDETRVELAGDIQTIFSRPWTDLYRRTRAARGAVDRDTVGHRGCLLGRVQAVHRAASGETRVRFVASRAVEVHDGLQMDLPGHARPFGFAVERLWLAGRASDRRDTLFEAPAGAVLEVALPPDAPDIPVGAPLYHASSQALKRRYRVERPKPGQCRVRRPIAVEIELRVEGVGVEATLHPSGVPVRVRLETAEVLHPARNAAGLEAAVRGAFEKLGDTPYCLGALTVCNSAGLFVPVSRLNAIRRDLVQRLEQAAESARSERLRAMTDAEMPPVSAAHSPESPPEARWALKVDRLVFLDALQTEDWRDLQEVIVDIAADPCDVLAARLRAVAQQVGRERIRLALPILMRAWERTALREKIARLLADGWRRWELANPAGWSLLGLTPGAPSAGFDLTADWPLYALNAPAVEQGLAWGFGRLTLSPEDGCDNMCALLACYGARLMTIVYQDTPLMLSETCALATLQGRCDGMGHCDATPLRLQSEHGERVWALERHCRTIVIHDRPFCLVSRVPVLRRAGAVWLRADFVWRDYAPDTVREVWRCLRAGRSVPGTHEAQFASGGLGQ